MKAKRVWYEVQYYFAGDFAGWYQETGDIPTLEEARKERKSLVKSEKYGTKYRIVRLEVVK